MCIERLGCYMTMSNKMGLTLLTSVIVQMNNYLKSDGCTEEGVRSILDTIDYLVDKHTDCNGIPLSPDVYDVIQLGRFDLGEEYLS